MDPARLSALTGERDTWIAESRGHRSNFGETLDGKARFDLEAGHSAEHPKLRRVSNPVEISEAYRSALWDSAVPDAVSYRAPLAQGMLGLHPGDAATIQLPQGPLDVQILEVEPFELESV